MDECAREQDIENDVEVLIKLLGDERERCAKICEEHPGADSHTEQVITCREIAGRLRGVAQDDDARSDSSHRAWFSGSRCRFGF